MTAPTAARQSLLQALAEYSPVDPSDHAMHREVLMFAIDHPDCCDQARYAGHITASAWVLNEGFTEVLLVHHAKLRRWLQPGGHFEPKDVSAVGAAAREAREETGVQQLRFLGGLFDVDVHEIPPRAGAPGHIHYDVRFAFVADRSQALTVSPESRDVGWFGLDADELRRSESLQRMVRKTAQLARGGYRP